MFRKNKKAFTLIELLVVIAIIGILATLAVVALQQARSRARDSKRVADVKQVQTALELFFNENGRYPTNEEWDSGSILSSTTGEVFMHNIPSAPTPADGDCLEASNTYEYVQINNGSSYEISFCLGKQLSNLPDGPKCLTPGGIISSDCSTERYVAPEYTEIKYGALYNWYVTQDVRLIPENMKNKGWDVGTDAQWISLRDYGGGSPAVSRKLKTTGTVYWNSDNGTDNFKFNWKGSGVRNLDGSFQSVREFSSIYGKTNWYGLYSGSDQTFYRYSYATMSPSQGRSIRLVRSANTEELSLEDGSYVDPYIGNNGYVYRAVKIDDKIWLAEHLAETKWNDGSDIPVVTDNSQWSKGGRFDYTDWFLPSENELALVYNNIKNQGIGSWSGEYWSSTEVDANNARKINFVYGTTGNYPKGSGGMSKRPVRKFTLSESSPSYSVRDIGPAGGWIFHVVDNGNNTWDYYEVGKNDVVSASTAWSSVTNVLIGTTESSVGSGISNTLDIINQHGISGSSAAKSCDDYSYTRPEGLMCYYGNNKDLYE